MDNQYVLLPHDYAESRANQSTPGLTMSTPTPICELSFWWLMHLIIKLYAVGGVYLGNPHDVQKQVEISGPTSETLSAAENAGTTPET